MCCVENSEADSTMRPNMINYLTCMSSTVFGGRDYIIIWVLVIISWLTMRIVVQHGLLLVASLNKHDMTNVFSCLMFSRVTGNCAAMSKSSSWVDEDSLRQQFWTSSNWISFFSAPYTHTPKLLTLSLAYLSGIISDARCWLWVFPWLILFFFDILKSVFHFPAAWW